MSNEHALSGRTLLMSGGSRGIGLAIAVRAAREGANVAFIAKTDDPDPRLPGTVHTAAAEIEAAGGQVLPIVGDIRDAAAVEDAVTKTVDRFGSVDIVVNNASALNLSGFGDLSVKRYDLMQSVNARGTFVLTTAALPHLLLSANARILTLSPPINTDPRWLAEYAPYTLSKYGMTMLTLGVAGQLGSKGITASCLWPRTFVATAAVANGANASEDLRGSRTPEVMADAAAIVLGLPPAEANGRCFVDEDVLHGAGVSDLSHYLAPGATEETLATDLFL
ncbi:SDR family oxidoreductase [Gordonia terrae]